MRAEVSALRGPAKFMLCYVEAALGHAHPRGSYLVHAATAYNRHAEFTVTVQCVLSRGAAGDPVLSRTPPRARRCSSYWANHLGPAVHTRALVGRGRVAAPLATAEVTFPQYAFGSPFQKLTTVLVSGSAAVWLSPSCDALARARRTRLSRRPWARPRPARHGIP